MLLWLVRCRLEGMGLHNITFQKVKEDESLHMYVYVCFNICIYVFLCVIRLIDLREVLEMFLKDQETVTVSGMDV